MLFWTFLDFKLYSSVNLEGKFWFPHNYAGREKRQLKMKRSSVGRFILHLHVCYTCIFITNATFQPVHLLANKYHVLVDFQSVLYVSTLRLRNWPWEYWQTCSRKGAVLLLFYLIIFWYCDRIHMLFWWW